MPGQETRRKGEARSNSKLLPCRMTRPALRHIKTKAKKNNPFSLRPGQDAGTKERKSYEIQETRDERQGERENPASLHYAGTGK